MGDQHKCLMSDGMSIVCFCIRGEDHNEEEFDVPVGETV
jgi:hypothetical protein